MNEIIIPLVSPLSRKYYAYASEKNERKHHRAEDVRICLEYICDHIIYIFVSEEDKEKWNNYKLHKKIEASRSFLNDDSISLLKRNLEKLPIAANLEMAKKNFNSILPAIDEDERDSFICLMSMILNGSF